MGEGEVEQGALGLAAPAFDRRARPHRLRRVDAEQTDGVAGPAGVKRPDLHRVAVDDVREPGPDALGAPPAAGMLEAEQQFRRVIGYPKLPALAVAVERDIARHTVATTPALRDRLDGVLAGTNDIEVPDSPEACLGAALSIALTGREPWSMRGSRAPSPGVLTARSLAGQLIGGASPETQRTSTVPEHEPELLQLDRDLAWEMRPEAAGRRPAGAWADRYPPC